MNAAKNPVEKVMDKLALSWLEASKQAEEIRLFIWRVPGSGQPLLDGFFALQQQSEGRSLEDLFLRMQLPFDTGYGYSEALGQEFIARYEATPDIAALDVADLLPCHTPAQLQQLLQRFTTQFRENLRYLILVLTPSLISDHNALNRWLAGWLTQAASATKLVLIDTEKQPLWQPLCEAYPHAVRLITDDIDNIAVMHQTARRVPDPDSNRQLFRRYFTDSLLLLEKGDTTQLVARGAMALDIARHNGWADQQVMMLNLIAGGWLKSNDYPQAIDHYRQAQTACADITDNTLKNQLLTQSIFGEAGVWFASKKYQQAAESYRRAADVAQAIPHPVFAIEGWRMSGFCRSLMGQREKAMDDYAVALRRAEAIPPQERGQTTLPYVFQDLLRIYDKRRASALKACAARWQKEKQRLIKQAEDRLPPTPTTEQVRHTDNLLQRQLEAAFLRIREEREKVIRSGDVGFHQVIHLARNMLHPQWNGLPEIAHPFDVPPGEWQALPTWAESGQTAVATAEGNP